LGWYYEEGPRAASWIKDREGVKLGVRIILSVLVVPLKILLYGTWSILVLIFIATLAVFMLARWRGWKWTTALTTAFAVAFTSVMVYYYFIEVPVARAATTEIATYYYTEDHISRPFNLRDSSLNLRWYEQHYPFGEIINEDTPGADMSAGAGDYAITWKPNFRFPGQYEEIDQTPFVQNHFREYMPQFGRYNRVDPLNYSSISTASLNTRYELFSPFKNDQLLMHHFLSNSYNYSELNPFIYSDPSGENGCLIPVLIFLGVALLGGYLGFTFITGDKCIDHFNKGCRPKCEAVCNQCDENEISTCVDGCLEFGRSWCTNFIATGGTMGGPAQTTVINTLVREFCENYPKQCQDLANNLSGE